MTGGEGIITRRALPSDEPALRSLYQAVFGDSDEETAQFFGAWFEPGLTIVIDAAGGAIAAAAYVLPAGRLVLPGGGYGCAMLYAIGTRPDRRGRGLGAAVTSAAAQLAVENGFPAVVLRPAEESLFDYYASRCGFLPFFEAAELESDAGGLGDGASPYGLGAVPPEEYRRLRRDCLRGGAYIDTPERGLLYQARLSAPSGGGLYGILADGCAVGCAAVERADGTVDIKELLLKNGADFWLAAAAAAARFPASLYRVRTACVTGGAPGQGERLRRRQYGMIWPNPSLPELQVIQTVKWYGLAFD